ncbi:MAG: hypothetical protein CVV27_04070 [Candidatus Melainabacteria bacterium HGW-Melainabacteria-1]|nr:MAG: hypothetical protein CVV27_04070 [Candidatus Melainabacteria bacterium HGW-Melainabacteria-1]
MNHAGDRIVMFISIGEIGGLKVLSRAEFLQEYPDNWRDLLQDGLSMYLGANGQLLAHNEAEQRLQGLIS